MYEAVKQKDNEKLVGLKSQMGEMGKDYEEMIRAREEARKQLEAKFEDVHRRLQENREFTVAEGKRVNDTLRAFQVTFETQLKETEEEILAEIEGRKKRVREELVKIGERLEKLDKGLEEEREARLRDTDEKLKPIHENLEGILSFMNRAHCYTC
eukprot:TRINITY_DN2391_c0_g1_i4.p2 TRINITY_DN2391_c0_g1~~TRINITY_DN2391_c0_g1_i4.p2  ORF type:complete len:155 (+),score=55.53 TRINITY_DN2391_c0_g1_i4:130-594(+)